MGWGRGQHTFPNQQELALVPSAGVRVSEGSPAYVGHIRAPRQPREAGRGWCCPLTRPWRPLCAAALPRHPGRLKGYREELSSQVAGIQPQAWAASWPGALPLTGWRVPGCAESDRARTPQRLTQEWRAGRPGRVKSTWQKTNLPGRGLAGIVLCMPVFTASHRGSFGGLLIIIIIIPDGPCIDSWLASFHLGRRSLFAPPASGAVSLWEAVGAVSSSGLLALLGETWR